MYRSYISGTGSYLPQKTLTNKDLEKLVDTTDDWITERTGIKSRHIVTDKQATSDIAFEASCKALKASGKTPDDIDLILVATSTPDYMLPSTACLLQSRLQTRPVMAFDLLAACSGFLYALVVADQFVRTGQHQNILVVGADVISRLLHFKDRQTSILFGDGAGAVIVSESSSKNSQIIEHHVASDGNLSDLLVLPAGGSRLPINKEVLEKEQHHLKMQGRDIFKCAVRNMTKSCQQVLKQANLSIQDIDWFIPHQANLRIIEAVVKQLSFPLEKVIVNIEKTGNTSAGSIPIALDEAILKNQIQRGQMVLMTTFGAGLTYGSLLMKY